MQELAYRPIPLVDLQAQYQAIAAEIQAAIESVIQTTAFIHGPFAESFERALAEYCGVSHAVGVGNGTDALYLALRALEVGPGDEVITTPFTFTATAEAIFNCGASVRFVDVDPVTRNMDPQQIEGAISPRTRAVLPVHIYGLLADMPAISKVARLHGLALIEDAAQAIGAAIGPRRAGSFGDAACFSFYPGKNLGAYGDAGAIVTHNSELAERIRMLADHGRISKYEHGAIGINSRLDGIQAAVLSVKLRHIDAWNARRQQIASRYTALLDGVPELQVPRVPEGFTMVWHLYVLEAERRDELAEHLQRHGVSAAVHYPIPLHLQPAYSHLGIPEGVFPIAERLARSVVSLPIYPELSDTDVERIALLVRGFYDR